MGRILVALAAFAMLGIVSTAAAESLVVLGNGRAPIVQGRRLDARGQALSNALHNALYKGVAKIMDVDSGDLSDDQTNAIETALGPSLQDFIIEKQLVVDQPDGSDYSVQVRVGFDRDRLNAAMLKSGISKRASKHFWERILVVVTENHKFEQSSAQVELVRNFTEQGYRVVDQTQLESIRKLDQADALARGDANAAVAIGRKFGAEIVVFGDAIADPLPTTNAGVAQRANINVRMLRTDNAQVLAANQITRSGVDQTPELAARKAFAAASEAMAQYLLDQLDRQAQVETSKPRTVEAVIANISYARYVLLKKAMDQGIGGVTGYRARDYQDRALRAEVDIEYVGVAEQLADALAIHRFDDFKLTVTKVTPNRIDFRVDPR
jgi:hypothetical protein